MNRGLLNHYALYRQNNFFQMPKTFDHYRSLNNRLHATLAQQQNYQKYLKRIDDIVNKKPQLDKSTSIYLNFSNQCHQLSKNHRSQQKLAQISTENQILLEKIITAKKKKMERGDDRYLLAMHEKRYREIEKINEENKRIAERVMLQRATIHNKEFGGSEHKESARRLQQKTFYQSRVKERKLPKLVDMRS